MLPHERNPNATGRPTGTRQPPDYRSRSARLRIFVLVAALMAVIVAMNEARKPTTWPWLRHGQRPATTDRKPIDTRLPPPPQLPDGLPGFVSGPAVLNGHSVSVMDKHLVAGEVGANAPAEQLRRGWQQVWEALTYEERNELARLLRTARQGKNPSESDAREWEPLATKLDQTWNKLFTSQSRDVLLAETETPTEQRRFASQVLTDLEAKWNAHIKPAFEAAGRPSEWTAEHRTALAETQSTLDAIAMDDVRDDTVWLAGERTAWFRLLESLQQSDPKSLARQSVGHVGFIQIFRQAPEYRGKVVTIRGTARLAYRVAAPHNDLGIREYCLFWIQPEDGSNRPIVVYALHPPDGFPMLTTEQTKIHEQVAVTGYFFKRWVYRAADGLNSVPLIVAAVPTWSPPATPPQHAQQRFAESLGPLYWPAMLVGVAGLALAAFGLVWLVNRQSRPSPMITELRARAEADSLDWDNLPATSSIEESLRHLEDAPPGS